ncbi:MAG: ComEC/Rec2 family competence protein [Acidimicrobiales bacterium]
MRSIHPLSWVAAGAWVGAWWGPTPGPLVVAAVIMAAVVASAFGRRPVWVGVLVAVVVVGHLAARTDAGLTPTERTEHHGEVVLVSDPQQFGASLRVDVRVGDERWEAWARGRSAGALRNRLAGERVVMSGRVTPPPPHAPWLARRHVVGRLVIADVAQWRAGDPASRAANGLRRTLVSGVQHLDRDRRSLYVGLLLGDQRDQGPVVADAFAGSGLTHLLAVSGQNVAFVLALVGPVLRRMRLGGRLGATVAVLAFFALVTRFEPSVLRATTMAGLGAIAVTFGREAESRRLLAAAVIVLVVIDPMIAHQLAFQLSVAASAGIVLWSSRLAALVPGPRPLAEALSVTVAAQAAVSPLLVPIFGGMPVSSLVANVLAAPATGPVVVWGVPAGIVAGICGGWVATVVHLPTAVLVGWIGLVAERCALLPLGEVRTPHLVVAGLGAATVWLGRRCDRGTVVALGVVTVAAVFVHPAVELQRGPPTVVRWDEASELHTGGGAAVLVLDVGARPDVVLEGLRRAGISRLDVVVARHGGRDVAEAVAAVGRRHPPRLVLAPRGHRIPGGSVAVEGSVVSVGGLDVVVESVGDRLVAVVRHEAGARPPPG